MKRIYQVPEIDIVFSSSRYSIMDPSGGENNDDNTLSNESKSFEEGELSTDMSKSGLWDD
jgi:hypothetical protein